MRLYQDKRDVRALQLLAAEDEPLKGWRHAIEPLDSPLQIIDRRYSGVVLSKVHMDHLTSKSLEFELHLYRLSTRKQRESDDDDLEAGERQATLGRYSNRYASDPLGVLRFA